MGDTNAADIFSRPRPSFLVSVLPIVTLLALILALSVVKQIIIYALLVAIVLSAVLFRRYIKQKDVINQGTGDSLTSVLATGSTIAFGSFAVGVPAFSSADHRDDRVVGLFGATTPRTSMSSSVRAAFCPPAPRT